jgi:hypothetical protein
VCDGTGESNVLQFRVVLITFGGREDIKLDDNYRLIMWA